VRGHPDHHQLVDDAAKEPALHRATRAKQLIVLVGSAKAIGQAVRVTGAGRRHTALDHRLAERCTDPA